MASHASPPSGEQHDIRHGEQVATIVEVGGGIRRYDVGPRPVLDPFPLDAICDGAHGTPLIPWPNRLADGRYSFDGSERQLDITEPDKNNAIHGLLRWRPWQLLDRDEHRLVMACRLHPTPGYPFLLDVQIEYSLGDDGLRVTTTATNGSDQACPYGHGQHPYLSPGQARVDDCELRFDAATRILTDDKRQLPTGTEPTAGTDFDFRASRPIGGQQIDHAFTDLRRDAAGRATVRLSAPDGEVSELWVDEHYPYLEIYTGDTLSPQRQRRGLGVEPMTCPPNAFATGTDVIRLEPGEAVSTSWGVSLSGRR
jgi:aldose 1-epimerase